MSDRLLPFMVLLVVPLPAATAQAGCADTGCPPCDAPCQPDGCLYGLSATIEGGTVNLAWPTLPGASSYEVDRAEAGGAWLPLGDPVPAVQTSLNDPDIRLARHYDYRVVPLDGDGQPAAKVCPVAVDTPGAWANATVLPASWALVLALVAGTGFIGMAVRSGQRPKTRR